MLGKVNNLLREFSKLKLWKKALILFIILIISKVISNDLGIAVFAVEFLFSSILITVRCYKASKYGKMIIGIGLIIMASLTAIGTFAQLKYSSTSFDKNLTTKVDNSKTSELVREKI